MASDGGARTRPGSAPATENGQRPRAWSAPGHAAYLTGHAFLPALIAAPFSPGLDIAFDFAIAACLVAAAASLLRGGRYVHEVQPERAAAMNRDARAAELETADA